MEWESLFGNRRRQRPPRKGEERQIDEKWTVAKKKRKIKGPPNGLSKRNMSFVARSVMGEEGEGRDFHSFRNFHEPVNLPHLWRFFLRSLLFSLPSFLSFSFSRESDKGRRPHFLSSSSDASFAK